MRLFWVSLMCAVLLSSSVYAEEAGKNTAEPAMSVNVNVVPIFFGSFSGNFEYLYAGTHGLLIEPSYASDEDGTSSYTDYGATLGYRWHWSGQQRSGFLGLNAGYLTGTGTQDLGGETFELTIDRVSVIPNIGYRAFWDFGMNITFRFGIGFGKRSASTNRSEPEAQEAAEKLEEFLNFFPLAFDGELSVGWCF